MAEENKSGDDRRARVEQDADKSAIVTGDHNVVHQHFVQVEQSGDTRSSHRDQAIRASTSWISRQHRLHR